MIISLRAAVIGILLLVLGVAAAMAVYLGSGRYDIAADSPHDALTLRVIEAVRDRSIASHAAHIDLAPLSADPAVIASGAEHYAGMCTGCHLAPGMQETDIRPGLYPKPPKLAEVPPLPPAQQFWIIKHGIKLTAMPAWGTTHDDEAIWSIVAFLQKLPGMSPEQYAQLTAQPTAEEPEHHHEH
jgi:mono/diheme cytochrome c family protein